jgi:hypothetical protein
MLGGMDEVDLDRLNNDFAEAVQRLETAIRALREIASPQSQWPARYGGPAGAMAARAQQALAELDLSN